MKETKKNWLSHWLYRSMPGSALGRDVAIKLFIIGGLGFVILSMVATCDGQKMGTGSGEQVRFTIEIDKE